MAYVAAVAAGLLGLLALASGAIGLFIAASARRAFEAALADDGADGLRSRGVLLVERIRHPVLRRIVNRRTGAMAGTVLIAVVRDRLATLRRSSVIGGVVGLGLVVFAFHVPGLME